MKRPGHGISPLLMNTVIGKKLAKDVAADQMLLLTDLEN
jgi:sialic acid synthase SpsE